MSTLKKMWLQRFTREILTKDNQVKDDLIKEYLLKDYNKHYHLVRENLNRHILAASKDATVAINEINEETARLLKERLSALGQPKREADKVSAPAEPPKGIMIDLLIPASRADDMLLMLGKAFEERWEPKYGSRRARQIHLLQSFGAIVGYWVNWIKGHLDVFKFFA